MIEKYRDKLCKEAIAEEDQEKLDGGNMVEEK